jgi:hypothetical protein
MSAEVFGLLADFLRIPSQQRASSPSFGQDALRIIHGCASVASHPT